MTQVSSASGTTKLVVVFWSIAFTATAGLLWIYRIGLTDFEPIVTFLVLIGLAGLLSVIFQHISGRRPDGMESLRRLFGPVGLLTIAIWLIVVGAFAYMLFRQPTKTIRIGVDLPLTGDEGSKGLPLLAGMYLALDQEREKFQQDTGYNLEFVIKDDAKADGSFDAQKGANNIESLITDDKVAAVLGPYNTDVAIKAIPIANQYHVPLVSPTTTSNCLTTPLVGAIGAAAQCQAALAAEYKKDDRSFFRLTAPNSEIAGVVAKCLGQNVSAPLCPAAPKFSKVVIIRDDTTYGAELSVQLAQQWQAVVQSSTAEVISFIDQPRNDGELSKEARAKISASATAADPVLIFFAGTKQLETLYDNVRQLPYTAFASNSSLTNSKFTHYLDGLTLSGPVFSSSGEQSIDKGSIDRGFDSKGTQTGVEQYTQTFLDGYKKDGRLAKDLERAAKRSGVQLQMQWLTESPSVSSSSATSYDATRIVIMAIKTAMGQMSEADRLDNPQKFREAIVTNMYGIEQGSQYLYRGVTGTYSGFDLDGAVKDYNPVSVYEYQPSATPRWQSR